MQNLTAHQVKVARVIIQTIFDVKPQRVRVLSGNELVHSTLDDHPKVAVLLAEADGWYSVNDDGHYGNGWYLKHDSYPGALMEINFDDEGSKEGLVMISLSN